MNRIRPSRRLRSLAVLASTGALVAVGAVGASSVSAAAPVTAAPSATAAATAAIRTPPVPSGLPADIEGLSPYVPPTGCDLRNRPGSVKLAQLVKATYGNTYGLSRTCTSASSPSSEHFDGRAVDTFFNARNVLERAEANAFTYWLLKTDAQGNPYANARRLGVMYIIWNDRMWSSYRTSEGWRPYNNCAATPSSGYDTACHRNHVHLSLSWEGAYGRTSFWTKRVAPVDWGPCRYRDLNWSMGMAPPNTRRCTSYATVRAPAGASALLKEMVPRSGMVLRPGMSGPAVATLQKVIGVSPATGTFGSVTTSRLKVWQRAYGLGVTGITWPDTWRAMLIVKGMRG